MNWRHRIVIVMLFVLAALPLAGTVCAMTCLSGSSAVAVAAHHEDGRDCESASSAESSAASSASSAASFTSETPAVARIGDLVEHDCRDHGGTLPRVAATAAQRADDLAVISTLAASDPIDPLFGSAGVFDTFVHYTPPPDTAPPTTIPLVLRV